MLRRIESVSGNNALYYEKNHHHTRNTCPQCGHVQTCRCSTPKINTTAICFSCLADNKKDTARLKALAYVPIHIDLPPKVIQAFWDLGDAQRGLPEAAMLKLNHFYHGIASPVFEHCGDLTWRMSHWVKDPRMNMDFECLIKVDRVLRYLTSSYGFEKEMTGNIVNNARYQKVPVEKYKAKLDKLMLEYSHEHSKLLVYNEPQWWAREAAVAIGKWKFGTAITLLLKYQELGKNQKKFAEAAYSYTADASDNPKPYKSHQSAATAVAINNVNSIKNYLKAAAKNGTPRGLTIHPFAFLLKYGHEFLVDAETYEGQRGTPKECYRNAARLTWSSDDLTYVEGFVTMFGVPLNHAWCSTSEGHVVDPTLKPHASHAYFGVPIKEQYLVKQVVKGGYCLLDVMQNPDLYKKKSFSDVVAVIGKPKVEESVHDDIGLRQGGGGV
jgi:hypothetical protein